MSRVKKILEAQKVSQEGGNVSANQASKAKLAEYKAVQSRGKGRVPGVTNQVVLKPPGYSPKSTSTRLAGGGMNLDDNQIRYAKQEDAASAKRTKAGLASISYSLAGTVPSLAETAGQAAKNYWTDQRNIPYQTALRDAGKVNAYAHSRLNTEMDIVTDKQREYEQKYALAESLKTNTPVDQNLLGQRLMAKSREKRAEATEGLSGAGAFVADTAVSIGANLPAIGIGVFNPAIGLGIMGAQAAAQKSSELNARGIAPDEALTRGVTSGAIEVLTEKVPLGTLTKLVKGTSGKSAIKSVLNQMGTEATEESVSYVANYIADAAASDPESKFSIKELALSALGGALSGGILGSAGRAVGTALNNRPAPRLPNMVDVPRQRKADTNAGTANKNDVLGLPSPRLFVSPNGDVSSNLPSEDKPLNVRRYAESTGTDTLKNDSEFDFNTLPDDMVGSINSLISAAQKEGVSPSEYIDRIAKPVDDIVSKAVDDLASELQNYTPKGVDINAETGVRFSNNEKWYSDFYAEKGRAPGKAERAEIARQLVMDDIATERGQYVPVDAARGYSIAQSFRDGLNKIGDDAIGVENVGDTTVVQRGRMRSEVVPNYSPVNAKQVIQTVQETGRQHNIPQETVDRISKIASKFNVQVEFVDTLGDRVNGKYENGKITISKDTKNPVMAVFTHELTHHIESSGQYEKLQGLVRNYMNGKADFDAMTDAIKAGYANKGVQLDSEGAAKEAVAMFIEKRGLLEDEAFVRRITQENPSIARQILNWIQDTIKKIGADADTKFLVNAQRLYEKAMRDGAKGNGGNQFSIDIKSKQLDTILQANPMTDGYHTGIRTVDDIKTYQEVFAGGAVDVAPDFTAKDVVKALDTGKITVYSSKPIEVGGFVTPSKMEAKNYAGGGKVYAQEVGTSDVAWIDEIEGQYAPNSQFSLSLDSEGKQLTPEQQEFFKDSKVRDENGNLLVVYHGTNAEFTVFDENKFNANEFSGDYVGEGFYFTNNESTAKRYGANVYPTYLNVQNPVVINTKEDVVQFNKMFGAADSGSEYSVLEQMERTKGQSRYYDLKKNNPSEIRSFLIENGHDGLVDNLYGQYAVFSPEQIKSVDNKNPTDDPDIRYSDSDISDIFNQMLEDYGIMPKGENPYRDVDVPKKTNQGRTRRFARTMMEAEAIPDSMIGEFEKSIVDGTFAYSPISDKQSQSMAERVIKDKGYEGALKDWEAVSNGKRFATKDDIVLGENLLVQAANAGDTKLAMKLAAELAAEGTRAGQTVQAFRLLKRMTPDGQLYYLQKSVQKINEDLLDRLKTQAPNVRIDEALASELLNAESPQDIENAVTKIEQNIADQIPPTLADKWNAWRYLAMLGNPRTHIRNMVGNSVFMPAVQIKNLIGTAMEARLPQADRTKAVLTSKDKALKDFARADFQNIEKTITSGGKLNPSDNINDKRTIFKTKALEWARKFNMNALEAEDLFFLRMHYSSAMAQFIKARGLTPSFLESGSKEANKAMEDARNYAIEEAQKATFRDASKVANALNKFKRTTKAGAVIGEGLFPFTKTPINILKRGVEYSPIGLIGGINNMVAGVKSGKVTASQAIDQMAAGLTGTGIVALGAWLASAGILVGGDSDDKKEALFDRLQGMQKYALKIGDYTYTLDWLAPSSLPLFVGVEAFNMSRGEDIGKSLSNLLDGLTKITEPMVEMSMLQGLNRSFKSLMTGNAPILDFAGEAIVSYFGQGVPTLAGQVARTVDDTRRTRHIDKNSGVPQLAQKFLQSQQAKLPGLSTQMMPYVDAWGRKQVNENVLGRAAQNFISPGYVSKSTSQDLDRELERLYKETGENGVLPAAAAKYIKFDGVTKNLTADEYFNYATERGQMSYKYLDSLISTSGYESMTDEQKAETVASIYEYANAVAKTKVSDYKPSDKIQKVIDAEKSGVSVADYYAASTLQKNIEADKDKNGKAIDGTEKINKREAVASVVSGMSFNKKDAIYKALGIGLNDAQEKTWSVPSVQKAVGSKEKFYKAQEIIDTIKEDKDEYGNSISGTSRDKEIAAIARELSVSNKQANNIYNELVLFKHSMSDLSSKQQSVYKVFKSKGMSEEKYLKYTNALKLAKGMKDASGKTIRGTLKQDQLRQLINAGMTPAQANYFYQVVVR